LTAGEERFDRFAGQAGPGLLRAAWLLVGNWPTAQDLVQTAFEKTGPGGARLLDASSAQRTCIACRRTLPCLDVIASGWAKSPLATCRTVQRLMKSRTAGTRVATTAGSDRVRPHDPRIGGTRFDSSLRWVISSIYAH
jgi:hypothetical protein